MTIIYAPEYLKHKQSFGHPESPRRLEAIVDRLKNEKLFTDVLRPEPATRSELEGCHTREYIDVIKSFGEGYLDPDTYHREETFDIASLAAGGGILAAKSSYKKNRPSFALLRPPGHHATRGGAGGFCYFNNIALAAKALLNSTDAEKVAIVDIDVHHGNGTNDIFYQEPDVLYISTHQWGIYPGTGSLRTAGTGAGSGYTVNIPFISGTGDSTYELAHDKLIEPIVTQYKPSIILVSIGSDAHYKDPLASLTLTSQGYLAVATKLIELARVLCDGKIAFYLEGGYHPEALAEVVAGIVGQFHERDDIALKYNDCTDNDAMGQDVVKEVKDLHSKYWKL